MNDKKGDPAKASRELPKIPPIELAIKVVTCPGFMAFSRILGLRANNGQVQGAFSMLTSIGATGAIANDIIEGWPSRGADLSHGLTLNLAEGEACYLAQYIQDINVYDWPAILVASLQ